MFVRCRWTHMSALHYAVYFDAAPVISLLLHASKAIGEYAYYFMRVCVACVCVCFHMYSERPWCACVVITCREQWPYTISVHCAVHFDIFLTIGNLCSCFQRPFDTGHTQLETPRS